MTPIGTLVIVGIAMVVIFGGISVATRIGGLSFPLEAKALRPPPA